MCHFKVIFAFDERDDLDICFFAMYTREYESQTSNSKKLYLAWLDSVQLFEPAGLRRGVFHEIIIGYLQHAKELG